jgi:hypothetical protein
VVPLPAASRQGGKKTAPARGAYVALLLAAACASPALAQETAAPPTDGRAAAEAELRELQSTKQEMQQRMSDFDARIHALEDRLGAPHTPPAAAPPFVEGAPPPVLEARAEPGRPGVGGFMDRQETIGRYNPLKGWQVVDTPDTQLNIGLYTYARYFNQKGLDPTYVDSLGRTQSIDIRNEVQLYKVNLQFKGWLFDPKFRYLIFIWTNNSNQGEGAQVVLAGMLQYGVAKWLNISAGIMPLPTTRSTNYSFPKWLRNDNRVMADEFYRGSYTSGIEVFGEIARGLSYRIMLGNNLSTLGVSSKQLDAKLDTLSGSLVWTPTTGEFGLANGFGDYDYHQRIATLVGLHYTTSTETAQGQPKEDSFENSQIRLTDGTLLFSADPFGTGGKVEEARYRMASVDLGVKYKGFSLEGQYYWRWVDHFKTLGVVPVDHLFDQGYALQASAMPVKDLLQLYASASQIWGPNGDPTEYSFGANIYPFRRRELRVALQALKFNHSPAGGYHLPYPVGANGWIFLTDWVLAF